MDRALGDGVVPSISQTLITIYNVKEFLEDGVFVPSEERMRATKGGKPESVTVQKKLIRAERAGAAGRILPICHFKEAASPIYPRKH